MNDLMNMPTGEETMSSREIAELTGKRHANVVRDIRNTESRLTNSDLSSLWQLSDYQDVKGETRSEYQLTKKGALLLASGYNPALRLAIINRWEELELKEQETQTPEMKVLEAMQFLVQKVADQKEELEAKDKQLGKAHKAIVSVMKQVDGQDLRSFCMKLNGVNASKINGFFVDKGWIQDMKGFGTQGYKPYAYTRDRYFTFSESHVYIDSIGEDMTTYKTLMLQKGAIKIIGMYRKGELPMKKSWNGEFLHDGESC